VELTQGDADAAVDIHRSEDGALHLIPRALVLGVGCRRGTAAETLERRFAALCEENNVDPRAVFAAASIDRKADEPGLLAFCRAHGWPLMTYSAQELCAVEGKFTASDFVREQIGVDNVCERSAVLASRGTLIAGKFAGEGVTLALAQKPIALDWRWQDG
jgi:cobalt-precorrin 5A hydrolase